MNSTHSSNDQVRLLLERVATGETSPAEAMRSLASISGGATGAIEDIGFAQIDHARAARTGFPEVVYGAGKTPRQVAEIASRVHGRSGVVLVTRTDALAFDAVRKLVPTAQFDEDARLVWADSRDETPPIPGLTVVSAGTADLPVATEAVITARLMGCKVTQVNDVGVAGLHRLLGKVEELREAKVLVVVAGMEGALPSVVAGLVSAPVIAVPTSVGYGASFEGLAALLAMMNSCASGVSVVNIDGGFAAGFQAALITRAIAEGHS
ncbi:MAG: nickel pincer cofactor biosynthesis protein LarB [Chloroflexi bacterium]|nr:nickel pincer cofactor biosynthesis protein LarB [Chloroflexota bacterium]